MIWLLALPALLLGAALAVAVLRPVVAHEEPAACIAPQTMNVCSAEDHGPTADVQDGPERDNALPIPQGAPADLPAGRFVFAEPQHHPRMAGESFTFNTPLPLVDAEDQRRG